jgi:hypothetical protein
LPEEAVHLLNQNKHGKSDDQELDDRRDEESIIDGGCTGLFGLR